MYAESRILERLEQATKVLGWTPERHSIEEVERFSQRMKALEFVDPKTPSVVRISREPTPMESRFIRNEIHICACDADYFLTRYCYVKDETNTIIPFRWRVPQKVAFNVIAEMEAGRHSIEIQWLKGRQLGVSTIIELLITHRILFGYGVNAVAASNDADKSAKMAGMMDLAIESCPWWLKPTQDVPWKVGKEYTFANKCSISIQSGKQMSGIARGTTPTVIHLSELADYPNPQDLVEASLFRAVHPSPKVFMNLESTGNSNVGWWAETWRFNKANWHKGKARLRPCFLPWFMGTDIYPMPTWLHDHPVPSDWVPCAETQAMVAKCNAYAMNTDYLRVELGSNWRLPKVQAWFWEANYLEHKAKRIEKQWLQEMPCVTGDTRISTDLGILRIDQSQKAKFCESGEIFRWIPRGLKNVIRIETEDGRIIKATPEHLVKLNNGSWKQAGDLRIGDKVKLLPPIFSSHQYTKSWNWLPCCEMQCVVDCDMARFLGYFMGDGQFYSGCVEISVDASDQDIRQDVHRIFLKLIGRPATERRVGNMFRIKSHSVRWLEILQNLGCLKPAIHKNLGRQCGHKRRVCVPECIFQSPRENIKQFLSALFECDGHADKHNPRASLYSKHDEFLRDVQLLLLGFGIRARFMKEQKKNGNGRIYTGREISIPAAHANNFYDSIGFLSQRKQYGSARRVDYGKRGDIYAQLCDTVKCVTPCDVPEEVFDISTETQIFSANGIEVHNCDDYEALQSKQEKVFPYEVLSRMEIERSKDYEVFAIVGEGIEEKFHPLDTDVDYSQPRIPITYSAKGKNYHWQLVPLHLDGVEDEETRRWNNAFMVYERPMQGMKYSAAADTAGGGGQDRTVVSVDREGSGMIQDVQVAELASDQISAAEATYFVMAICAWYDVGMFAAEQVRKPGDICQTQMRLMGWPNSRVHSMVRYDGKKIQKAKAAKKGWYTHSWSRPLLLSMFIAAVENGWYKVNSKFLKEECDNFEARDTDSGKVKMEHMKGKHDDRLFAAAISYFIVHDLHLMIERSKRRYTLPESKLPDLVNEPCVLNSIPFSQVWGSHYPGRDGG